MVLCSARSYCPCFAANRPRARRRAAEAALLPAAYALTMLDDPTLQRMALPPLLALAAWAALGAALEARIPQA